MWNIKMTVTEYGGPEMLQAVQEPLRAPDADEVRVKVQSAGVALADIMRREGLYPMSPEVPFVPGYDAVGMVDAVGAGVEQYAVGDRVAVFFNGTGGYASHVYARMDEVVPIPAAIDATEAAACMLNYVTAYQMLHRIANVSEGERILIHGASGGVGTALLNLGRLAKLEMYGTASGAKHQVVAAYGALPIDYQADDFVEVLASIAPEGMAAVFDPIGGSNWERSMRTLGSNGRFVGYGYTSVLEQGHNNNWVKDWTGVAARGTTESGNPVHMYSITALKKERLDWFREDVQAVMSLLEAGKIHPLISHRIPLQEAAYAQNLLQESRSVGKIILVGEV
ncbi:medium chain dehydrogenase/reductase family protein [Paenibacillus sp. chi10]|uniref:Medium chain dehydrogenase/reductase family protein n=1 Tax=Paenibacillus suaedae TaxID=3077233 RepID=A0AAJ2N3J1_9BACL|nr:MULTISPECIES: medium chain dehydrogenase/reductase family protein [unclassified Paenibacillus]MDT8978568.1 medium chain dehydrogenase/reductase family protein [Paenibacillus sp. chi10]GAV12669.1 alcohol dehydrogenase zinc-binding domain protein [Paenibacillus sp. NAIST15-1]